MFSNVYKKNKTQTYGYLWWTMPYIQIGLLYAPISLVIMPVLLKILVNSTQDDDCAAPIIFTQTLQSLRQWFLTFWLLQTPTESLMEAADP
jgi:hypothetical protein